MNQFVIPVDFHINTRGGDVDIPAGATVLLDDDNGYTGFTAPAQAASSVTEVTEMPAPAEASLTPVQLPDPTPEPAGGSEPDPTEVSAPEPSFADSPQLAPLESAGDPPALSEPETPSPAPEVAVPPAESSPSLMQSIGDELHHIEDELHGTPGIS